MDAIGAQMHEKDYSYWVSNREKYQRFSTKEHYDQFLEDLKKHEQSKANL